VVRPAATSSRFLLALLLAAVAIVAALGAGIGRDLVHRSTTSAALPFARILFTEKVGKASTGVAYRVSVPSTTGTTGLFGAGGPHPVAWLLWTALPGGLVVLALLALMLATLASARRRGLYARPTVRLLGVTGLAALLGGPLGALAETVGGWATGRGYADTPLVDRWLLAALLMLVGCAFLAVRELLRQAGDLHDELAGVI
jgi:hypothetical protein